MAGSAHSQLAVRVLSDLHLEHAPLRIDWEGEDVLIIAGDVSPHPRHWRELLAHYETGAPDSTIVLLVAGNHDFYGRSVSQGLTEWRALASPRVRPLENDSVVIRGVRFWGATMWTDLDSAAPALLQACMRSLTDFDAINGFGPHEFVARHTESRDQLRHVLGSTPEPLVVITHHLPSRRSQDAKYSESDIGPSYYSTDLGDLVDHERVVMWVHGHTHSSVDYTHGSTRVVCNPRGYCGVWAGHVKRCENARFDPSLTVTIDCDAADSPPA